MRGRNSTTLVYLSGLYFADMSKFLLSPFAATENLSQQADRIRPGWPWFGYMAFGVAFWTGVGLGIRAVIARDKAAVDAARRSQRISRTTGAGWNESPGAAWRHRRASMLGEHGAAALDGTIPEIRGPQRRGFIVIDGGRAR